mgnify:CR=1 FL=1
MKLGLCNEKYWRMSPSEAMRWHEANRPRIQIGGLDEDMLNRMASDIDNNENYI